MMSTSDCFLIAGLIVYFGVIAFVLGMYFGNRETREEAVKRGYAEYYLDENNERQFRWKNNIK